MAGVACGRRWCTVCVGVVYRRWCTVCRRVWVRCAGVGCTYGYRVYVSCGVRVMNEGYNVLYSYER